MARLLYGGTPSDFAIDITTGAPIPYATAQVWDARTGGLLIDDLTNVDGDPITSITADQYGLFAFYGPDDMDDTLWIDTGTGARLGIAPTDAISRMETLIGAGNALPQVVWPGTGGVGTWPSRPAVAAGVSVNWISVSDADAPPPPGALQWDTWDYAPGAEV